MIQHKTHRAWAREAQKTMYNRMTFRSYMAQFYGIDHRFGDLAEDIARDDEFPDSCDFNVNMRHLTDKGVDSAVIDTFCASWASYKSYTEGNMPEITAYLAMGIKELKILTGVMGHVADSLKVITEKL